MINKIRFWLMRCLVGKSPFIANVTVVGSAECNVRDDIPWGGIFAYRCHFDGVSDSPVLYMNR